MLFERQKSNVFQIVIWFWFGAKVIIYHMLKLVLWMEVVWIMLWICWLLWLWNINRGCKWCTAEMMWDRCYSISVMRLDLWGHNIWYSQTHEMKEKIAVVRCNGFSYSPSCVGLPLLIQLWVLILSCLSCTIPGRLDDVQWLLCIHSFSTYLYTAINLKESNAKLEHPDPILHHINRHTYQ